MSESIISKLLLTSSHNHTMFFLSFETFMEIEQTMGKFFVPVPGIHYNSKSYNHYFYFFLITCLFYRVLFYETFFSDP